MSKFVDFLKDNKAEIAQVGGCIFMLTGTLMTPFATKRYLEKEAEGFATPGEKTKAIAKYFGPVILCETIGTTGVIYGCFDQHNTVKGLKNDIATLTVVASTSTSMVNEYRKYVDGKEGIEAAKDIHKQIVEAAKDKETPSIEDKPRATTDIMYVVDPNRELKCIDEFGMEWKGTYNSNKCLENKLNAKLIRENFLSFEEVWFEAGAEAEDIWKKSDFANTWGFSVYDGLIEINVRPDVDTGTGELRYLVSYSKYCDNYRER